MPRFLRCSVLGLFLATATVVASPYSETQDGADHVVPAPALDLVVPEHFTAPKSWRGMQSIQADRRGEVFLLRTETMEEYPVLADGQLGDPRKVQVVGLEPPRDLRIAAMGEESGEWFVFGHEPHLFSDYRDLPIDRLTQPTTQAEIVDGEPFVLVQPWTPGEQATEPSKLPMLVRWTGTDWDIVVEESTEGLKNPMDAYQTWGAILAPGQGSDLWLAYLMRPEIRRIHAGTGKTELRLETDPDADLARDDRDLAKDEDALGSARIAVDPSRRVVQRSVHVASRRMVHHGAAVSPDGVLFLLVADPEDAASRRIRRWNSIESRLEEIGILFDVSGIATMAFGRDGLHIAQFDVQKGRVFIDSGTLEMAAWRPVADVLVDGVPQVPAEGPENRIEAAEPDSSN